MRELRDIVRGWADLRSREAEVVLATVVSTSGSTYRRPGARLLLSVERWIAGGISGGCLERDVLSKAWWRTREGPVVVTYDSTSADDEEISTFGLGCNGRVDVLLERLPPSGEMHPLEFVARCLESRQPAMLLTVFRGVPAARTGSRVLLEGEDLRSDVTDAAVRDRLVDEARRALSEGRTRTARLATDAGPVEVLLEVVRPPRSLVVFGTGQDAVALVKLASTLGFHVTAVSNTSGGLPPGRFEEADRKLTASPSIVAEKLTLERDAAVVIMTHNMGHDGGYLRFALEAGCGYVGVLGPRTRTDRLLSELSGRGFELTEAQRAALYSPVGLNIGAEQPEEISLAIVAEIQAAFSGADPRSLESLPGTIHPRAS